MIKETIKSKYGSIPIITNESKSKKVLIYFHGLDGSAGISKPLFKNLPDYKVVAIESRGHMISNIKASRFIYKHLEDYLAVINHYKNLGYKVWILGESMGAAYATMLAYKTKGLIEGVFTQSIPNKLANIMVAPKWTQIKIQFMTTVSFFTNINYKYKASVNYELLSSNRTLHRLARFADKTKVRQVRETLATWAVTKRAWNKMRKHSPLTKVYYFQPTNDVVVDTDKVKKIFKTKRKNLELILVKDAKHILMYEPQFDVVIKKIKKVMG